MRIDSDGTLLLSPSDLSGHLACAHLTNLNLQVQRGDLERPHVDDTHGDLVRRKGDEHEAAYLARLVADGRSIVRIPTYDDEGFDADEARRLTEEAIRAGEAEVIYQPYLSDGTWRGFADFLERVDEGSGPDISGPYTGGGAYYEAVDTKLARSAKPAHVLQLCFYSEQLGRITMSEVWVPVMWSALPVQIPGEVDSLVSSRAAEPSAPRSALWDQTRHPRLMPP